MKSKFYAYITAILLLAIFVAKDVVMIIPIFFSGKEWISLHEYETQDEPEKTNTEENAKSSEIREFIACHGFAQPVHNLIDQQKSKIHPTDTLFKETVHLSIPTPPPDCA